jgi:hypothetical protein
VLRGNGIPFVSLAVLSVPDTINFGIVRAGIARDSSVIFKNTGIDTLKIISQGFSNSAFRLSNTSQSKLTIAPITNQSVNIQYTPSDTSNTFGFDTIRTAYKTYILLLQGSAIPFSSTFPIAPTEIVISLTGVIGAPYGLPNTYSYYYDEPFDFSHSHDSVYYFSGGTSGGDYDQRHDEVDQWSSVTEVPATIDTNLIIKLLSVRYNYLYGQRDGLSFTRSEGLKLHNISLTKNGDIYTGIASGPSLRLLIDTAYIQCDYCHYPAPGMDNSEYPMNSLIGFTDSAKLSIIIK